MHVDLGIWGKLTRVVVFLLIVAALIGVGIWYLPVIQQNQRMRQEILKLNQDIQKEQQIAKQLQISITALQKDPKTVERLARERLGYAKPGETVIRFDPPTAAPTPATPKP